MSPRVSPDRFITVFICSFAIIFAFIVKVMPVYFYVQGKKYLEKQDFVKAHSNLKSAYNLDKNNKDYRYYYVKSLLGLSPSFAVQKEVFEIAESDLDDSAQNIAQEQVYSWRNNIFQNMGNNYIEQVPSDTGVIRWDVASFPLKFMILDQSETVIPPYYVDEIKRAFSQWQASTQFLTFSQIDTPNDANILIKILPMPSDICSGEQCQYVVGFTTPDLKGNILKRMNIVIYAKDPMGNYFSDKELFNTALHEIGHSLGIMGHSYSSGDIMFMSSENPNSIYSKYRSSFQYLSSKDINTIKLLYKMYPTICNSEKIDTKGLIYSPVVLGTAVEVSSRKLREAQNYIKKAPDLASGYIDLGIAYAEMNKPREAVKAMQEGYKRAKNDTERYFSLYNLASLYFNSNNFKKAEEAALMAQKISQTEEIQELILKINLKKNKSK